uniref:NADH-ubiquinone oxidoreductase chain 1 n=1 Tax=Camallanus cotti TaxID=375143 RepID=A0A343LEM2_9BILA|nr:NADH dehydrogenase subunit 1 [Camallanus cotti]ATO58496.1 NADH dehydrogenase subunit 1 [Camallanus cotti]
MLGVVMFFLVLIFLVLQAVAFVTLYERHLLGGSQERVGPNKVSFWGLAQAIFDGIKLLKKEVSLGSFYSLFYFMMVPSFSFFIMLMLWFVLPYFYSCVGVEYMVLLFMCLVGVTTYGLLISGIVSKCKYGFLGSMRASSQSLSYEVVFYIIVLCMLSGLGLYYFDFSFSLVSVTWFLFFFIMVLSELGRAPFDFAKGESELVSGYNVEYSGVPFVLLFLKKYGSLLFYSCLMSVFFFFSSLFFVFLIFSLMIFVRSSYPRYRYDKLMFFFWIILMPFVLILLYFVVGVWIY